MRTTRSDIGDGRRDGDGDRSGGGPVAPFDARRSALLDAACIGEQMEADRLGLLDVEAAEVPGFTVGMSRAWFDRERTEVAWATCQIRRDLIRVAPIGASWRQDEATYRSALGRAWAFLLAAPSKDGGA